MLQGTVWPVSAVAGQYVQLHESAPSSPTAEAASSDVCVPGLPPMIGTSTENGQMARACHSAGV